MKAYTGIVRDTMKDEKITIQFKVSESATQDEIEKEAIRAVLEKTDCNCVELVSIFQADGNSGAYSHNECDKYNYVGNVNAAHERTDIEITEEMRKHDDDIMNDPDF